MSGFGYDESGVYKPLADGRVLRVTKRMYNTLMTLSSSQQDLTWLDGW